MSQYNEYRYDNATSDHVHQYLLHPVIKILSNRSNRTILDIGCGNGWLVNLLIDKGYNAYGTDASASGIAIANQKHAGRFCVQNIDTDELPFELRHIKFDTVISTEVIEHLYNPKAFFDFCKKILCKAENGELIISTPYHGYIKNIALAVSGKMDDHFTVLWDGGHIKFWSRRTLTKALLEKGFSNIRFHGCGRLPLLWKSMIIRADYSLDSAGFRPKNNFINE